MIETIPRTAPIYTQHNQLPKPQGWPLVGTLPKLLKDPFGFFLQTRETYGDIYRLNLGLAEVVVLNHPRHAQHIFVDNVRNYRKGGALWDAARVMLGNGLLVGEGDFWIRQRRMLQPQFHRQRLSGLTSLMVDAIDEALNAWEVCPDEPFQLTSAFNHLTMKVITRALFGAGLAPRDMDQVSEALTYSLDYILRMMVLNALPSWLPVPGREQYRKSIAQMDRHVYRIIADTRQKNGPENHLLAMLLDTVDEETGEGMTDQQLRDEVITLFLAGYETSSLALSWAFDYLGRRPEMMLKLQAEVDAALGGRKPTFADLPKLAYARMVLQETLRLRPSAWQLPRVAVEDDEIDGYPIPAGTHVVLLIYTCHRHPDEWPDPERFDPERFSAERSEQSHKLAWMPFGAGQRMCIGRDFALTEGQLALAMVAQRYQIIPAKARPAEPKLTSTLRPKGGVPVTLGGRSGSE